MGVQRVGSIDVFRALTMFLMIFVNDFWTLREIPDWLKHSPGEADAMGFSDVIFPAFLFIVGLSIPYALDVRLKRERVLSVWWHIVQRTLALLIMGVFLVNLENIYPAEMIVSKWIFQVLLISSFFLIWNDYRRMPARLLGEAMFKIAGVALLLLVAWFYRGGHADDVRWLRTYWWGILGLIGWAYFFSAALYLLFRGRLTGLFGGWLFFVVFNLLVFAPEGGVLSTAVRSIWMPGAGAFAAFAMAGVLTSVLTRRYDGSSGPYKLFLIVSMGVLMLAYGWYVRPDFGGLSKIRATPAWIGYCTGISLLSYALLHVIADLRGRLHGYHYLKPAGESTLTCYLLPYVYYALWSVMAITLPLALRTGIVGLVKSLLFAWMIVYVTGLLQRVGIKLKI